MRGVEGVDSGAKDRLVEVIGCWPSQRPSERWPCAEKREKEREGMIRREGCDARLERGTDHHWTEISVCFSTSTHARRILSTVWIAHLL